MRRLLLHPLYPALFQVLALALLIISLYALFAGPPRDEYNPGSYLVWYLWWAALPFTFLLLAEHFFNLGFNFEENLAAGRLFVLLLIALALLLALLFRRRVWCRSLCPVGALGGLMSRLAPLKITSGSAVCRQECSGVPCRDGNGGGGCPLGEAPGQGVKMNFCNLCGECLKACPHEVADVAWLGAGSNAGDNDFPLQTSLAVLALLGVALDTAVKHLADWPIIFWQLTQSMGAAPSAWLEMAFHAVIVSSPLLFLWALAAVTRGESGFAPHLLRLSRPLLPLAALAVAALALRPLLIAGPQNLMGILLSAGVGAIRWIGTAHRLEGWPLAGLQWSLMILGLVLAFRDLRGGEESGRAGLSGVSLSAAVGTCLLFAGGFLWLFSQQMIN